MKILGEYACDKASMVINGICFSNGFGDGEYTIYYCDSIEEAENNEFENLSNNLWVDLRETNIYIWSYDCDNNCKKIAITKENINAEAIMIFKNNKGDFALVKEF